MIRGFSHVVIESELGTILEEILDPYFTWYSIELMFVNRVAN